MRLSRANIPLESEDRTHSQAIYPYPHYNLAPHFWPGFINLQHFCHSRWRNPVRLSKSGLGDQILALANGKTQQEIAAACKGVRPNHIGIAMARHKRAGRIEERDGKLYATRAAGSEHAAI